MNQQNEFLLHSLYGAVRSEGLAQCCRSYRSEVGHSKAEKAHVCCIRSGNTNILLAEFLPTLTLSRSQLNCFPGPETTQWLLMYQFGVHLSHAICTAAIESIICFLALYVCKCLLEFGPLNISTEMLCQYHCSIVINVQLQSMCTEPTCVKNMTVGNASQ